MIVTIKNDEIIYKFVSTHGSFICDLLSIGCSQINPCRMRAAGDKLDYSHYLQEGKVHGELQHGFSFIDTGKSTSGIIHKDLH